MSEFQFFIIIVAGIPAIICLAFLIYYFFLYIEERVYIKRCHRYFNSFIWCSVKGDFVKRSDCHCITADDYDCSGCYIYEQNRTDIFINFDEGDEPF